MSATTSKPAPSKLPRTRTFKPVSVRDVTPFSQSDALDSMTGPAVTFYVTDKQGPRFEKPRLQLPMVAEPIQWLWPGKIPLGRVTLIEGSAGAGKSTLALDLAARVSSGKAWPDGTPQRVWDYPSRHADAGSVGHVADAASIGKTAAKAMICCRQDDAATVILPRLEALGANPRRIVPCSEFDTAVKEGADWKYRAVDLPDDMTVLEYMLLNDSSIKLVVIDPLSDFCYGKKAQGEMLHRLNRLAAERRVAIVVTLRANVRFDRHGQVVVKSRYATDAVRCTWCCVGDPETPERNFFLPTLMNFAKLPQGFAFRLGDVPLTWEQEPVNPQAPLPSENECQAWLREVLEGGDVHSIEIIRLGKQMGYSESRLRRAGVAIGVQHPRVGYQKNSKVYWSLGKGNSDELKKSDALRKEHFTPGNVSTLMAEKMLAEEFLWHAAAAEEAAREKAEREKAAALEAAAEKFAGVFGTAVGEDTTNPTASPAPGSGTSSKGPTPPVAAVQRPQATYPPDGNQGAVDDLDDYEEEEEDPVEFPASDAEIEKILRERSF